MTLAMKKLLVLIDRRPAAEWMLQKRLERLFRTELYYLPVRQGCFSTWEKLLRLRHSPLLTSLRLLPVIRSYDIIYARHAELGLMLALLSRLLRVRKPLFVIAQLVIVRKKTALRRFLRDCVIRYAVRRVHTVVVNSTIEAEYYNALYGNGDTRFVFVPLGIELANHRPPTEKNYIFSGGRNSDFSCLIKATAGLDCTVKIATPRFDVRDPDLPENVELFTPALDDDMDRMLAASSLVVIPLMRADASSGQRVLLNAMALGKPIIVSNNRGVADYTHDSEAVVTVPPHNPFALRKEIENLMHSQEERHRLGAAAKEAVKSFSTARQAERVAELLAEIIAPN